MPQTVSLAQGEPRRHLADQPEPRHNGALGPPKSSRNHLPDERRSITHKFLVGGYEGYLTVGLYPDGQPGEIFITMAKEGSTVSGFINSFAQAISIGLQYGIPLKVFIDKFSFTRFEPCGWTGNPAISQATSVMDYVFRFLRLKFFDEETATSEDAKRSSSLSAVSRLEEPAGSALSIPSAKTTDAPFCKTCGSLMQRNGSCHVCGACGWTSGCS